MEKQVKLAVIKNMVRARIGNLNQHTGANMKRKTNTLSGPPLV